MKMKRLISFVIVLLLICGMPVAAFADNVEDCKEGDTVETINSGDTMSGNYGTVTNNEGILHYNNGTVANNYHDVVTNGSDGKVTNNNEGATVATNYGTVETNNGTVGTNKGTVTDNNGTVSYAESSSTIITNNGTVAAQNLGTVKTNNGTVNGNFSTVETNNITGVVNNKSNSVGQNGTVGTNYGTVNESDGSTHYGVQVEGSLFQKEHEAELDLSQFFSKAGYVLTGYIQHYQMGINGPVPQDGLIPVDGTVYKEDCPNLLTLIWQAIAGSDEETEYFGPGCYISVNGKQYILVEIKGEDYYLASCEEYTQEELAEADELLESLLTEEQLGHVTGEAGILEGELNELFFGGGSRIVFPCDIGMIFH